MHSSSGAVPPQGGVAVAAFLPDGPNRLQIGWPLGLRRRSRDWCSPRQWALRRIQRTSAVICVVL
jgi:hypothetical protein